MHRRDRITFALTGATAAALGYTLVRNDRARDTLPGVALLSTASLHYEQATAPTTRLD